MTKDDNCRLRVRVTPRSGRNRVEVVDGQVKVWVTAAPADGQANAAVSRTIAEALDLAPSFVAVIRGHASREKTLQIEGMDLERVLSKLEG
jgi:uncharacterized protein